VNPKVKRKHIHTLNIANFKPRKGPRPAMGESPYIHRKRMGFNLDPA
jgi:hypothetical protein